MPIRLILLSMILTTLTACGSSNNRNYSSDGQSRSNPNRAMFITPVEIRPDSAQRYVQMKLNAFESRSGGYDRIEVELRGGNAATGRRGYAVINGDISVATRVGLSLSSRIDDGSPYALARQVVMASRYCPSGNLSPYTGITRYNNPRDIDAIVAASTAAGDDVIPASARGTAVASTRLGSRGGVHWVVNLRCS